MNKPNTAADVLEKWLDEAMGTSLMSVGIHGYKGSEENIDERRNADFDKAKTQALKQLYELCMAALPDEDVVASKYGYHSDEKKYGYRIGKTEAIEALRLVFNQPEQGE